MPAATKITDGIQVNFTFRSGDRVFVEDSEVLIIRRDEKGEEVRVSLEVQPQEDREKKYAWTQPMCDWCWTLKYPQRRPTRMRKPQIERCCNCNHETNSGIYIRVDPNSEYECKYPTKVK